MVLDIYYVDKNKIWYILTGLFDGLGSLNSLGDTGSLAEMQQQIQQELLSNPQVSVEIVFIVRNKKHFVLLYMALKFGRFFMF